MHSQTRPAIEKRAPVNRSCGSHGLKKAAGPGALRLLDRKRPDQRSGLPWLEAGEEAVGFVFDAVEPFVGAGGFACFLDAHVAVPEETGAGGDEVAHDDVFLEATQPVGFAEGSGIGEDPGGVLEGGGGNEGLRFQRGFGDTQEDRLGFGGLAALTTIFSLASSKAMRSTWSPQRNSVSPGSVIFTLRNI